jgi:predicted Rossmann fold nucleotide-binding protein DprA/Smf involved in DNA uptake
MTTISSPIARAIAELETEAANLQARLVKVQEAIGVLRNLFHLPATPVTAIVTAATDIDGQILAALAEQPLSPATLAANVGVDRHTLRTHIVELERAGKVVSSGATHDRRIALAAPAAKEALRR